MGTNGKRAAAAIAGLLVLETVGLQMVMAQGYQAGDKTLPVLPGDTMDRGVRYLASDDAHYLVFQNDGDLVLYDAGKKPIWRMSDNGVDHRRAARVELQPDGQFVVSDANGAVLWSPVGNDAEPTSILFVDNGVLGVLTPSQKFSWTMSERVPVSAAAPQASSGIVAPTAQPAAAQPAAAPSHPAGLTMSQHNAATNPANGNADKLPLRPGQALKRGTRYLSGDGQHYVEHASDGNLIIRKSQGNQFLWGLNDQRVDYQNAQTIEMLADGRLVASDNARNIVWEPVGNDAAANSYLVLDGADLKVVSPGSTVTWSSSENPAGRPKTAEKLPLPSYNGGQCAPEPGYSKCRVIENPRMYIYGTNKVSDSAMNLVKVVYEDMTSRLKPAYPKEKLNYLKVLVTNGETSAELAKLPGIGNNGRPAKDNDWLRGGGGKDEVWITEQMICKSGVRTRGAKDDNATRTFDQVIHEIAHTMEARYDRSADIRRIYSGYKMGNTLTDPHELFPMAMQQWFNAPDRNLLNEKPDYKADLETMFTSRTTYSCANYRP